MPPTWGTIAKSSWPQLKYAIARDGNEVGWNIIQDNSGGSGIFIMERWHYDELFFVADYSILAGDERGLTKVILKALGTWDTQVYSPPSLDQPNTLTWAQLEAGGSIYTGGQKFDDDLAVEELLQLFYDSATTFQVEQATQKFLDYVDGLAKAAMDATVNSWATPPPPAPYQPPVFNPGSHEEIVTSIGLEIADGERAQIAVDGTGRVIPSFGAVPT